MKTLRIFFVMCAAVTPAATAEAQTDSPKRPNILLLFCDDIGFGDLGFSGAVKSL